MNKGVYTHTDCPQEEFRHYWDPYNSTIPLIIQFTDLSNIQNVYFDANYSPTIRVLNVRLF